MTLEKAMKLAGLERDIAQLERAINNPNMVASNRGSSEHKEALERLASKRMRLADLKKRQ
jgi:hypothetical protein